MLERTRIRLESMYRGEPQLGLDGIAHPIDGKTMISAEQGQLLATFHEKLRPKVSIEIGMAYGFSTLFIADSMAEHGYGFHLAVDPFQRSSWHGIAMASVDALSFGSRVKLVEDYSASALPRMYEQGVRADYVYIDGLHTFDAALCDFCATDRLLNVGGLVILDDMWMPSIRKVASFVRANLAHYTEVPTPIGNVLCLMKQAQDTRAWNHFVDFA